MATKKATEKEPATKEGAPNKTEAVREALAQGMVSPAEIARQIKDKYGWHVAPNYVSTIKRESKSKARAKKTPKGQGAGMDAAIEFVEQVGGVEEAKSMLEKIERIRKL
jgi:hypothetical protein